MPSLSSKIAQDTAQRFSRNGLQAANKQMAKVADKAISQASSAMGRDVFKKTAAKADDAMVYFAEHPHVIRVAHNPTVIPTAAEAAKMDKEMTVGLKRAVEEMKNLTSEEQATYRSLGQMMQGRVDGQLALQQLLLDGKLTVGSVADPKRNLITALGDLSKQDLAPGIDRTNLLAEIHQELADPIAVSQEHKGTCAATSSAQILWSIKQPVDYLDYVRGLASPEGAAKLPNGEVMHRAPDWRAGNDRIPGKQLKPGEARNEGRTISSKLVQPTFMQGGIGDQYVYNNTLDKGVSATQANKVVDEGGLTDEQSARLMSKIFQGENFTIIYHSPQELKDALEATPKEAWDGERIAMTKDKMMESLRGSATPEDPVRVSVDYELSGGHAILVTGFKDEVTKLPNRKTPVTVEHTQYINPWGRLESMPSDSFKLMLDSIISNGGTVPVKV